MFHLDTPRLTLREFTQEDLEDLHEMLGDPEVMKYYPAVKTRAESQEWLDRVLAHYEKSGSCFWATVLKETGEIVGQVGILQHGIPEAPEHEIGYQLKRKFWGKGYAREAAAACRDYAFRELGQSKVISMIDPRNAPSIRVAESIGMRFERRCFVRKFDKEVAIYGVRK